MTEILTDQVTEVVTDDTDSDDLSGWFCIATDPFPCPSEGCGFVASYMTAAHLIVVWPRVDDPHMLGAARSASSAGRNPKVREYEKSMGGCIPWDEFDRLGRPVHGRADRPDGYEPMRKL